MGHHYPRAGAETRRFAGQEATGLATGVSRRVEVVDIEELREENEKLRLLVVELSRIVARNVTERK